MTAELALEILYEDVGARMTAEATAGGLEATPHVFGWRRPAERPQEAPAAPSTARRVVWVPGDDGKLGVVAPAVQPGRNPRPIGTLMELFTVYLEAADLSSAAAAENELAQWRAARNLFDAWYRAAWRSVGLRVQVLDSRWVDDKATRRFGATLRLVCTIEAMIPDGASEEIAGEDDTAARAAGTTEELDVEEEDETAPPPPAVRAVSLVDVALAGEQTVDGLALEADDRVLLVNQSDQVENGLWLVALGAWSRTADELEHGTHVYVEPGGTSAPSGAGFRLTTADPITVGVTPLVFARVSP